ncbi:uncharacterized protein BX663DRAFT_8993 [Cokeromyces recurvatus]|uniref:uncharacterized protein n=1 Tax=Cokeromyces recurvatus TaxID=90255 RepID=UPI00221EFBF2|nr:uncharacterized protein BX663DRAFT_8993 [Cokeromyces recurvatus]KAI7907711.1 hypothetical protein BX663DRAFT_8993 [Cokeromyces recurvatus]
MNDHQKKKFINPLRKFSLLQTSLQTEANCVPVEKNNVLLSNKKNEFEQKDIISLLPREITLKIFYLLSFQDLIQIQLTCKTWNRITQDVTIWRNRFYELNSHFTDIYAHKPLKWLDTSTLPWKKRYCQAITFVNWRMGNVQRTIKIDNNNHNRVLAVKLRNQLLVTLSELNYMNILQNMDLY